MRYEYYNIDYYDRGMHSLFVKIQLGWIGMSKLVFMQWMVRIESELNSN